MSVELTITVSEGGRIVRIEDENRQSKTTTIEADHLRRKTIDVFGEWLRGAKITKREELQVLGEHLYDTIFQGEVRSFFEFSLARVDKDSRLRVQLNFEESAAELAALPWEYLWYPPRQAWFSTAVNLVLSRFLPDNEGPPEGTLDAGESPLRILIMVSEPEGLAPVVDGPVVDAIQKLAEVHAVDVLMERQPTGDSFVEILEKHKPHVLHFMGHGRFQRLETPPRAQIALIGSPGAEPVHWCRDQDFAEYFLQARVRPRLVFLHLCESAAVDFNASFSGIAPQLLRKARIPAVIAMQFPIENRFAIQFSRAFYEEIARSSQVDHAVQVARYKLTVKSPQAYDSRVFGTPVLYMYARDPIIRPAASSGAAGGAGGQARSASAQTAATVAVDAILAETAAPAQSGGTTTPQRRATDPKSDQNGQPVRPHEGILHARGAAGDPVLRNLLREARRQSREQVYALAISEDDKASLVRAVADILQEINADPRQYVDILDRHYQNSPPVLQDLINKIEDALQGYEPPASAEPTV